MLHFIPYISGQEIMTRTFLPVGQGACYMERFHDSDDGSKDTIVLYDCGSLKSGQKVIECLEKEIAKGSIIQAVFISHFDEDHVNGLPLLLEEYHVKHLFLPLLTEAERKLLKLCYECCWEKSSSKNNFFRRLFDDDPGFFETLEGTRVHFVGAPEDNAENYEQYQVAFNRIIASGSNVSDLIFEKSHFKSQNWLYIPFNFRQNSRGPKLKEELEKEYGYPVNLDKALVLIKEDPQNIKRIKAAYKRIPGSLNVNSMVLFSGSPVDGSPATYRYVQSAYDDLTYSYLDNHGCFYEKNNLNSAGCLYMGDYDTNGEDKWGELTKAFETYCDSIGCIQIPHHGSSYNYYSELTKCRQRYYVISAGKTNRYSHPHGTVLKDMLSKRIAPYIVTEEAESMLSIGVFKI